jgi:hypothetical protein
MSASLFRDGRRGPHLADQLERSSPARKSPPFRRGRIDHANKRKVGSCGPGDNLVHDQNIDLVESIRATRSHGLPFGVVSDEKISMRAFGKLPRTSSSIRSTPGPPR